MPEQGQREPLLRVEDLRVEYLTSAGDICAVDDVSFTIHQGDVFGLAGESGSGKSTIVQAMMRILRAPAAITGGRVLFEGDDVLDMDEDQLRAFRWRRMSLVFQSAMNALNPVLTVGEQIGDVFIAHQLGSREAARERAGELLEMVGIQKNRLDSFPHELSGGMRQRVVIAIALALKPPLVIMDEPTTALDVVVQKEILGQIAELQRELGFSVLFITHDLSLMLEICSHVGILYAGRLVEVARSQDLFDDPRHPYTRGLMRSFPSVHGERRRLEGIGGSPPDLKAPPSGCRFHPRCDQVSERCKRERPELIQLRGEAERIAACHDVS